jgi:LuxR family maltose regulon positive regulatory protein
VEVGTSSDSRLVASHLSAPEIGVSTIVRGRLLERLSHGAAGQVTIVSGEPASGKTSLLVQWVTEVSPRHRVAWLTVPARTDDEITFWEYLLAAVAAHEVPVDELRAALLDGEPPGAAWLTSLANRLGGRAAPLVVVIDDLHELRAAAALASLAALVEMRPAGVSFVLATCRVG